jgi:UDP-N-acetylmuramoylalanine--D-glutamate ligase
MARELSGAAPISVAGSLTEAVRAAAAAAREGDVVVFSPACSSFDMFRNFEERGDAFREAVRRLAG